MELNNHYYTYTHLSLRGPAPNGHPGGNGPLSAAFKDRGGGGFLTLRTLVPFLSLWA